MAFTWIPFYKELAETLLQYKNDRSQLIKWMKIDLNKVKTRRGGHSLISYLIQSVHFQQINDIDPFSVFGIFNRTNQRGDSGRRELLLMFHDKFNLSSDVPTDFNGIPPIEIISSNFFCMRNKNVKVNFLWDFFEKILHNENISGDFDYLLSQGISISELSLSLYLLMPDKYIPLCDSNIKMLYMYKYNFDINTVNYEAYNLIIAQLLKMQNDGIVTFNSFAELTAYTLKLDNTDRIWMWRGDETAFTSNQLECGSDIGGNINFSSFVTREDFRAKYQKGKGKLDYLTPAAYWDFMKEANEGEIVVVFGNYNGGHILYGWGIIVSQCEFDYQNENPLRRRVKWNNYSLHNIKKESLTQNPRFFHSVNGIEAANIINLLNIKLDNIDEIHNKHQTCSTSSSLPIITKTDDTNETLTNNDIMKYYSKSDFLTEVFISAGDYEKLENLLQRKKNLILQGAPGVGKTFAAKRLAYAMMGEKDEDRIMQVQFHQNYSYEDFVMGYKPNDKGGFELEDGIFYQFCKRAANDSERKYFFIIDEINRGNLSKIFGELLMLIENDYRNKPIQLAYKKDDEFAVPSNLYIIGMMNTADRSLAMIDYALRRRFSFFEMKPGFENPVFKEDISKKADSQLDNLVKAIIELNKVIEKDDSLGSGFCIGHSYLCKLGDDYDLENIVEYDIIPMLREYWFDNDNLFNQEAQKLRNALK